MKPNLENKGKPVRILPFSLALLYQFIHKTLLKVAFVHTNLLEHICFFFYRPNISNLGISRHNFLENSFEYSWFKTTSHALKIHLTGQYSTENNYKTQKNVSWGYTLFGLHGFYIRLLYSKQRHAIDFLSNSVCFK